MQDSRAALFEETAARRRLANANIVEKDFWVCWTLHRLHTIPGLPRLLFKGGTSLSKCFGLIHRFSEDIDLGIEREDIPDLADDEVTRCLVGCLDPNSSLSGKKLEKATKALKPKVHEYVTDALFPAIKAGFRAALGEEFVLHSPDPNDTEPKIRFAYPRALSSEKYVLGDYVEPMVLLEPGARSDHDPIRTVLVRPYAAEEFEDLFEQPACSVVAQAPERTLLEKALILHTAIYKGSLKARSSRHAYDLVMMQRHPETMEAVTGDLFERVAFHKWVFGAAGTVGHMPATDVRLVPEGDVLARFPHHDSIGFVVDRCHAKTSRLKRAEATFASRRAR